MMTGSHQHVGNWPGKTVDQKEGEFRYNGKQMILATFPEATLFLPDLMKKSSQKTTSLQEMQTLFLSWQTLHS